MLILEVKELLSGELSSQIFYCCMQSRLNQHPYQAGDIFLQ